MAKRKTATTYIVEIRTTSRYGLNEDRYFRNEAEARREIAELKEWFKNCKQTFNLTSHKIFI
jgi:hypothetical protein